MWDVAMSAGSDDKDPSKSDTSSEPIRWGPATGAGPLGEDVAKTFRSASYTEHTVAQPVTLYRVATGKSGSYWTRTPPPSGVSSVKILVPVGARLFEGATPPQNGSVGGENQIFLPSVDPSWEIK